MSLVQTWLDAELANGKTQRQAMLDMNKATGYKVDHTTVFRWRAGAMNPDDPSGRSPKPKAREYMLRIAIPAVIKGISKKQAEQLVEALL